MSAFYDRMRALSDRLFAKFGVPATITSAGTRTVNKLTGVVTMGGTTSKPCLATLGKRTLKADDGTVRVQSIAGLNTSVVAGDTLTVGTLVFTVGDVEEDNPEGGTPISWVAVLS